jgi:hypothetical protein
MVAVCRATGCDGGDPGSPGGLGLDGLERLWFLTRGDPAVCVALLDGPVDQSHPCFRGADLTPVATSLPAESPRGAAGRHGTHVASVIFGQPPGPVRGIAPRCRGLVLPVFASGAGDSVRPCSQLDLARAIALAAGHGAQVINVSGGEFTPTGAADPLLAKAVQDCARRGVLIVAAAGNDGCPCLHVPAALPCVLAVGAMDARGEPLPYSNWGPAYQAQGLLAPGEGVLGAAPGGGAVRRSGTSCAAAVTSGVAALLLSWQRAAAGRCDPRRVREALLATALGCDFRPATDCRRLLAGRLNVQGAVSYLNEGIRAMAEATETLPTDPTRSPGTDAVTPEQVQPAACGCACGAAAPQLVYALGQLGYDLVSEARLDSLVQKMGAHFGDSTSERLAAFDPRRLLDYLEHHPWDAAAVEWTLTVDATPVYAIRPAGPFAAEAYKELRRFLRDRLDEGAERISVPGRLAGQADLLVGPRVPVIAPDLRGTYSWTTRALLDAVAGPPPAPDAPAAAREEHDRRTAGVCNFLERVYHEVRNLGLAPPDRALNYAATNAFQIEKIYEAVLKEKERMELDAVGVTRSPLCRPRSECWDVELAFFFPDRPVQAVRKVYRFTVDVSDVVPVTVGRIRSWFTR